MVSDASPASDDKAAADVNATSSEHAAEGPAASETEQNSSSSSLSSSSSSPAASSAVQGLKRNIYAESATTSQQDQHAVQDVEAEAAVVHDEIAYQKLRGSKETMYSKLKNRIRTLEDNLNLTNR